jgi:hypothetical protein
MLPYFIGCGKGCLIIFFFAGQNFQYNDAKLTFAIPQMSVKQSVYQLIVVSNSSKLKPFISGFFYYILFLKQI